MIFFEKITYQLSMLKRRFCHSKFSFLIFLTIFLCSGILIISSFNKGHRISLADYVNQNTLAYNTGWSQLVSKLGDGNMVKGKEELELEPTTLASNVKNPSWSKSVRTTFDDLKDDYGEVSNKIPRFGDRPSKSEFMKNKKKDMKFEAQDEETGDTKVHFDRNRKKVVAYQQNKPFHLSDDWDESLTAKVRQTFNDRVSRVGEVCRSFGKNDSYYREPKLNDIAERMVWVTENNFVWCPIFKAASTTWVESLLKLKGIENVRGNDHGKVRELFPLPRDQKILRQFLKEAMKLIVVRHPLDRILSAYRDKMLRNLNREGEPYRELQKEICREYPDIKLPEGVDVTPILPSLPLQPTFNQFLLKVKDDLQNYKKQMLLKGRAHINLHWRPYWGVCAPCTFNYTAIVKVESFAQDQEFVIRARELPPLAMIAKAHSSNFDNFTSTEEARKEYYSRVPSSLLQDIIELYDMDFKLFGYNPDFHLNLTLPNV